MQILVLGDVILDIYLRGKISRISPEAPVPVIKNATETYAAGGAANVAVNLANIGEEVMLCGIVGNDDNGEKLKSVLSQTHVKYDLLQSEHLPTISKLRIIADYHHLARIDHEYSFEQEAERLFERVQNLSADILILSDYNKGSVTHPEKIITHFKNQGTKILVDPKKSISSYKGAWLIKPNRNEFVRYLGDFSSYNELIDKAQKAICQYDIAQMLVTLGNEGMMYVNKETAEFYPARTQQVADITGAGDTVLVGLAYGISKGLSIHQSILLAKTLAEISVTKVGTYVLTKEDLQQFNL